MRSFLPILVFLVALLGAAGYLAWREWAATSIDIGGQGTAALVIGAIGSLVLGGGLMALVFLSSRRGYDDAAELRVDPKKSPKEYGSGDSTEINSGRGW